ncbi:hypothetical protein [Spirosoma agri]|uniref:hypothetical protein n=1 Tax=Spirosoma agri TaxID=1987381 RepID=UPI001BAE762D|nr:hypothetical protein [Spirosoma agri]
MITKITTIAEVEGFAHQLVTEGLNGGFHPDDPFEDYVNAAGKPLYTSEEAAIRNILMEQCFKVCGDDVYEIVGRITFKGTPFESMFDENHEQKYNAFMESVEKGEKEYKPNGVISRSVIEVVKATYN